MSVAEALMVSVAVLTTKPLVSPTIETVGGVESRKITYVAD